jgi:uncharacterized protein with HEPN domain
MERNDLIRIRHMLDAAREAVGFVEGKTRKDLDEDRKLNLSLVRLVEIIGEAAGKVTAAGTKQCPEVPWTLIVGMRNRLAHGYDDIDLDIVWHVVSVELPPLIILLEKIVAPSK